MGGNSAVEQWGDRELLCPSVGGSMQVGDLVQEKYVTQRIGVVIKVTGVRCYVRFADGDVLWSNHYHFWRLE